MIQRFVTTQNNFSEERREYRNTRYSNIKDMASCHKNKFKKSFMLQKSIFPHKLVIHLILDQAVYRASIEIRELTQGDTELGQTLAASVN